MCKSIDPEPRILGNWLLGVAKAELVIIAGPVGEDDRNHRGVFVVCFKCAQDSTVSHTLLPRPVGHTPVTLPLSLGIKPGLCLM